MKRLLMIAICTSFVFANEYYSKIEPIESYLVESAVNGEVIFTNEDIEGKNAKNSIIVEIDSKVDKVDLEQTKNKIELIKKMIQIEKNNYERLKKVTTRSDFDKDSQLLKSINLESNYADLLIRVAQLEDSIRNKKLIEKNRYIYDIAVKEGDWVSPGTLLYEAKDLSKGKLEIFIPIADAKDIKNKKIFLNGKESNLKINKLYEVADAKNISSYKVEIFLDKPENFSSLVKIEFK